MRRLSLMVVAAAAFGLAVYSLTPTPAFACSGDFSNYDPVAESPIILEGRFVYAEVTDIPPAGNRHILAEIDVYKVWKGERVLEEAPTAGADSSGSQSLEFLGNIWIESQGICADIKEDPTGKFSILGVLQRDNGTFGVVVRSVFYYGDDPSGERYDAALVRMASYPGAAALPALGSGPDVSSSGGTGVLPAAGVIAAIGATLLGLGILSRVRSS